MSALATNVHAFIERASQLVGAFEAQSFAQEAHTNCADLPMQSPIEHLFWVALKAMSLANFEDFNPDPVERDGLMQLGEGINVSPQRQLGKYRVDFFIERAPFLAAQATSPIVVELDGHDFHDKDKWQRSYEKARDRFLVKQGYRVLHYTGSDIVRDPFKAAHEVLVMLNAACSPEYDQADPFGVGA